MYGISFALIAVEIYKMESSAYVPVVLDIADDSETLLKTVSEAVDVKEINIENLNETVADEEGGTGVDFDFYKEST